MPSTQPDVTLTTVWGDAVAMQRGDLDPNVAFMQGRMKVAGSMGVMMGCLPLTSTPEYQDLRRTDRRGHRILSRPIVPEPTPPR